MEVSVSNDFDDEVELNNSSEHVYYDPSFVEALFVNNTSKNDTSRDSLTSASIIDLKMPVKPIDVHINTMISKNGSLDKSLSAFLNPISTTITPLMSDTNPTKAHVNIENDKNINDNGNMNALLIKQLKIKIEQLEGYNVELIDEIDRITMQAEEEVFQLKEKHKEEINKLNQTLLDHKYSTQSLQLQFNNQSQSTSTTASLSPLSKNNIKNGSVGNKSSGFTSLLNFTSQDPVTNAINNSSTVSNANSNSSNIAIISSTPAINISDNDHSSLLATIANLQAMERQYHTQLQLNTSKITDMEVRQTNLLSDRDFIKLELQEKNAEVKRCQLETSRQKTENETLISQLERLQNELHQTKKTSAFESSDFEYHKLEYEKVLQRYEETSVMLQRDIEAKNQLIQTLDEESRKTNHRFSQLELENSSLRRQLSEYEKIRQEYATLQIQQIRSEGRIQELVTDNNRLKTSSTNLIITQPLQSNQLLQQQQQQPNVSYNNNYDSTAVSTQQQQQQQQRRATIDEFSRDISATTNNTLNQRQQQQQQSYHPMYETHDDNVDDSNNNNNNNNNTNSNNRSHQNTFIQSRTNPSIARSYLSLNSSQSLPSSQSNSQQQNQQQQQQHQQQLLLRESYDYLNPLNHNNSNYQQQPSKVQGRELSQSKQQLMKQEVERAMNRQSMNNITGSSSSGDNSVMNGNNNHKRDNSTGSGNNDTIRRVQSLRESISFPSSSSSSSYSFPSQQQQQHQTSSAMRQSYSGSSGNLSNYHYNNDTSSTTTLPNSLNTNTNNTNNIINAITTTNNHHNNISANSSSAPPLPPPPFATTQSAASLMKLYDQLDRQLTDLMTEKASLLEESARLHQKGGKVLRERTRLAQIEVRMMELTRDIASTRRELATKPS